MTDATKVLMKCLGKQKIRFDKYSKNNEKYSDNNGYYTGYCQCGCEACTKGAKHCQGLTCRGD
jgi:hypothetical protein